MPNPSLSGLAGPFLKGVFITVIENKNVH
ncbi:protein of unknown function [Kyrpidia spormannii]|uniref:Uncharacterized protein n=2 Tax=Kyrpidia spormannii TaxID=2055160 RepID=A0ACA8ZAJ6_9BACL|nr:protein of unknown function [Kyrpidia spormannii]CAB3393710.1 protein of unknown function [Kyrpidia spormannii]